MIPSQFEGSMGDKRKRVVEEFGYDTKQAAHMIRLLRMGIEFLREGTLHVEREDVAELMEIRKGRWALEEVKAEAGRLFKIAEEVHRESRLPDQPDRGRAEQLLMEMIGRYHGIAALGPCQGR